MKKKIINKNSNLITEEEYFNTLINSIKDQYIKKYNIDSTFFTEIFDCIISNYGELIALNYDIPELKHNVILYYRIGILICTNYIFDKHRMILNLSDEYKNNFIGRIIAQMIYTNLTPIISKSVSPILNHPSSAIILSTLRFILDKTLAINKSNNSDYKAMQTLIVEAMKSLEATILLVDTNSYNQAMTVFRLYLEQVIIVISLVKNPTLFNKYLFHQELSSKYADNTSNKEVLKIIEEKNTPARDIKSYLNYGWIEDIPGFEEIGKRRFSIKMMCKLCNIESIYEIYCQTTDYVHMNYMNKEIDWVYNINRMYNAAFSTLSIIIDYYKNYGNLKFNYNKISLDKEFETIAYEFIMITLKHNYHYDFITSKKAR